MSCTGLAVAAVRSARLHCKGMLRFERAAEHREAGGATSAHGVTQHRYEARCILSPPTDPETPLVARWLAAAEALEIEDGAPRGRDV